MRLRALDLKLLRDLRRMRGQVLAVALVVASGTALLVMALSSLTSLRATADAYYERHRFAEVFAAVKRAPERLADRIAEIPGVQTVETRVSAFATVDVPGMAEPVTARLVSLPPGGQPLLNRLALREGRLPRPGRTDEAVLLAPFAEAHGLRPGDRLSVVMAGAKRELRVTGTALSPEYVYAIAPGGLMPDDRRFGVIWMGRDALEAAYDLDGAFNDLSLALLRGTDPRAVIARLDALLDRYGGTGAIPRADHTSHWFLTNEFAQLRTQATVLPAIFLAVAAFLTNAVLARLIATERREIALMKAFGYGNVAVGWHYAKLALAMAAVGVLLGWAAGAALGRWNTGIYTEFFRFPFLQFRPSGAEFALSAAVALGSALLGAVWAVRGAVALPPAEAMRPPAPESFRGTAVPEALAARLDAPTRMVLRSVARTPVRSALTVTGVALSVAILVMAMQWSTSIGRLAASYFGESQHQDMVIGFHEPRAFEARFGLARLPGVLAVEPLRISPADLSANGRTHRGAVTGLPQGAGLQVIRDVRGWDLPVPRSGIVLGTLLAAKLGVGVGDTLTVEIREGARPRFETTVAALHETWIGMPAYIDLAALNRRLGDPPVFEYASLLVDPAAEAALFAEVKELPGVTALMVKRNALAAMEETIGETILIFIGFFVAFSSALAYGVIYNATRVALSERGRELATLRVLGYTRGEISYILFGETALLVLAALPLGCALGAGLVAVMGGAFSNELFRVPPGVPPAAYAEAVSVVLAASVVSMALVRRRLDRLDLIAVLKTRE